MTSQELFTDITHESLTSKVDITLQGSANSKAHDPGASMRTTP